MMQYSGMGPVVIQQGDVVVVLGCGDTSCLCDSGVAIVVVY